jgi:hypothetical protein
MSTDEGYSLYVSNIRSNLQKDESNSYVVVQIGKYLINLLSVYVIYVIYLVDFSSIPTGFINIAFKFLQKFQIDLVAVDGQNYDTFTSSGEPSDLVWNQKFITTSESKYSTIT